MSGSGCRAGATLFCYDAKRFDSHAVRRRVDQERFAVLRTVVRLAALAVLLSACSSSDARDAADPTATSAPAGSAAWTD